MFADTKLAGYSLASTVSTGLNKNVDTSHCQQNYSNPWRGSPAEQ